VHLTLDGVCRDIGQSPGRFSVQTCRVPSVVEGDQMAMRIRDYTALPIGTKISKNEIKACPHCGKAGLAEEVYGKTFFTHSQAVGINERGDPEIRWVMCQPQSSLLGKELHE
jgi:hypothetical protein